MLPLVFNPPPAFPQLAMVADVTEELAQKGAQDFGFERWVASSEAVIADDAIDLVDRYGPGTRLPNQSVPGHRGAAGLGSMEGRARPAYRAKIELTNGQAFKNRVKR